MDANAQPGWYPQADGTQRWWNGTAWDDATAPAPPVQAPPAQAMVPVAGYGYAAQPGSAVAYPGAVVAPKNPGLSLLGSFFIPGLGQFINGEGGKGAMFLIVWIVSIPLMFIFIGFFTAIGAWIWSMVDAYSGAQQWNARRGIIS